MSDYDYCISLSITHPSIAPEEITEKLGIEPTWSHKVGEQRKNSKGRVLKGINKENFWRITPHDEYRLSADNILLEDYLFSLNQQYSQHKDYFSHIVATGGYVEYFIGWFENDNNLMATLSPTLLKSTGELSIAIGIDAYSK